MKPVEVGVAAGFDGNDQELWGLVAVQLVEAGFDGCELVRAGLEQQQGFCGGLELALPMVDGLDGGDQRGAGDEALFNQGAG